MFMQVRLLQYSRRVHIAGLKEKRKAFLVDLKHTQVSKLLFAVIMMDYNKYIREGIICT